MITIIGAGPVGCYTGYLLAKAGEDVQIFEEHERIGVPVQCTGITTTALAEVIELRKDFILNKLKGVRVFSKKGYAEIKSEEIVLDRERFDRYLAEKAMDEGVEIFLNHRFINKKSDLIEIKNKENNKTKNIRTDKLIGADGPLSAVARASKMYGKRDFYLGMQARVKIERGNFYEVFFGSACPNFFAWIVPENDSVARVGLATKSYTKFYFSNFLNRMKTNKIMDKQAGLIPIFNPKNKIEKSNVYLVGDAAGQVKATTGGGIVPGLASAKILVDCVLNKKSYEKEFKKGVGRELSLNLKLRRVLNRFNDRDYDYLIDLINKKKVKDILNKYNRDYPSKLLFKLLINEPRFLYFIKRMF